MASYGTIYHTVTQGVLSGATAAIGLAGAVGAAAGLVWAGYGPDEGSAGYWALVPASLGGLGGIAVGEVLAFGVAGYSPFSVGVADYVPLTSMTFRRYFNGAYVYMAGILGSKAAQSLYPPPEAEPPPEAPPVGIGAPPPAPPAAPTPAKPVESGV